VRLLAGKPLLAYAIEAAQSAPLINRVIVTTDNQEIARVAKECGAEAPFLRPADISDDLATTESALQHAVLWLDKHEDYHADIVVFLTCTAVFRKNAWVNEVVRRLLENDSLDSAFVAYSTYKNFWRKEGGSWTRLAPDIAYASRQVRESIYREETPTACATRADLIRQGRRVGPHVDLIVTDDERVTFDIHSEFDFWLAEKIVAEWPMERPLE
jgi:N-acylneuraminate cytidylyltransferase